MKVLKVTTKDGKVFHADMNETKEVPAHNRDKVKKEAIVDMSAQEYIALGANEAAGKFFEEPTPSAQDGKATEATPPPADKDKKKD